MTEHQSTSDGTFECEHCWGEGTEWNVYGDPTDPESIEKQEPCGNCRGTGIEGCVICGEPARVIGANGRWLYCSPECAYDDDNWPSCAHCGSEPRDPTWGIFCSYTCEQAVFTAIHAARLERWREEIKKEIG
jgi:hypothetical protein